MRADASVASASGWRTAFVVVFALQLALKLVIAARLPLFGDAAFYWLESRHLAWGYSDLPGMTAWLIGLGTGLGGHTLLAVRSVFLLLGAGLPWLVVAFARRHFGSRAGWQAGLLALGLPLAGSLGVMALPDVALTFAVMLAVLALDGALDSNRWRYWLLLVLALLLAQASHYRAGMLLLAGLLFAVGSARGRGLWRNPRWYLALALGALGAAPALIYNLRHGWAGLAFQMMNRNPWSFQAEALLQPLEQALAVTPLLYLGALWALWLGWRRRRKGAPWDLIACVGGAFLVGYFVLGLFADNRRFNVHWPLPGYLPLLAVVPLLARRLWHAPRPRVVTRGLVLATCVSLAAAQLTVLGFLLAFSLPASVTPRLHGQAYSDVFEGWHAAGAATRRLLDEYRAQQPVLVADNFRLAAELAFAIGDRQPVYSLDSPLNSKHGRAVQLGDWGLDEAGLFAAHGGQAVLLVVEETALRAGQKPAWLGSVCRRFTDIQPLTRIDISRYKRIAFYHARLRPAPAAGERGRDQCIIWTQAYARYPQ